MLTVTLLLIVTAIIFITIGFYEWIRDLQNRVAALEEDSLHHTHSYETGGGQWSFTNNNTENINKAEA